MSIGILIHLIDNKVRRKTKSSYLNSVIIDVLVDDEAASIQMPQPIMHLLILGVVVGQRFH